MIVIWTERVQNTNDYYSGKYISTDPFISRMRRKTAASYPDVSLSTKIRAQRKFSFPLSLALRYQSLACHSRFALAIVRKTKCLRRR